MEKQVIIFNIPDSKKHSVRYDTKQEDAAVKSIYVSRIVLGNTIPKALRVTIEEV